MTTIAFSFVFHSNDQRKRRRLEDNNFMPSFSCLRGAKTRGKDDDKDDDNLCDCHRLLVFKGTMMRREKKT